MSDPHAVSCPQCGMSVHVYRNPFLTVDLIIRMESGGIVLIERKNPPYGWALPGGFVDYGESLESVALREALEETGLVVNDLRQFRAYSNPDRDPRFHTVTVVFTGVASGTPQAADDALHVGVFMLDELPSLMAFDHLKILTDYLESTEREAGGQCSLKRGAMHAVDHRACDNRRPK